MSVLKKGVSWKGVMLQELLLLLQTPQVSCSELYPDEVNHMEKPPFVVSWIFRSVMFMNRIQASFITT